MMISRKILGKKYSCIYFFDLLKFCREEKKLEASTFRRPKGKVSGSLDSQAAAAVGKVSQTAIYYGLLPRKRLKIK